MSFPLRWPFRVSTASIAMVAVAATVGCFRSAEEPAAVPVSRVTVLAAASTKEAVEQIASEHERETNREVDVSVGASNALAQQILAGAPADLFLSASEEWADSVAEENLVAERVDLLANRLVLIVPNGNPAGVQSPQDLLGERVERIAIAGENVPAGTYAEQALTALDLFAKLEEAGKLARGHDVRATLTFVERGEAEAGIVYATDAIIAGDVETVYEFDAATHDPIVYPLVLTNEGAANPAAKKLFERFPSPEARAAFRDRGFEPLPIGHEETLDTATSERRP